MFIMEIPNLEMDDLGRTPFSGNRNMFFFP